MTSNPPELGRFRRHAAAGHADKTAPAGRWLGDLASPQVPAGLLVVPLGSTEQHGPHLPISTDTDVAVALASRLAAQVPDAVVAPAVAYGSSGEHAGFPGTLSIGQEALELLVVELVRSADHFARVLLVNGHGGNAEPVRRAVAVLRAEGREVRAWGPRFGGDAHAGRTETSLLLALGRPVGEERPVGAAEAMAELLPAMLAGGVVAVSPIGVLGDATGASPEEGEALLHQASQDLLAFVRSW